MTGKANLVFLTTTENLVFQSVARTSPLVSREKGHLVISLRYQEKTGRINVVVMKAINLTTPKRLLRTGLYRPRNANNLYHYSNGNIKSWCAADIESQV